MRFFGALAREIGGTEPAMQPKDTQNLDTQNLLILAREKSHAGRQELFRNVWDLFEKRGDSLSDAERSLMLDILRQISHDVEMEVRSKLAKRLASSPNAPRELVQLLANDDIGVAHSILLESKVLADIDLIEVVRHRSFQHQLAVAVRRNISPDVCNALADTGNEAVVVSMLRNETANVSFALLDRLADQSQTTASYQGPLLQRPGLPEDVASKMYGWVSAALRQYIVDNFEVDIDDLDDSLSDTFTEAVEEAKANEAGDPTQRLIDKLHAGGQLTVGYALKALRQSDVNTFELTLARLLDLRPRLFRRILYERGGEGLTIACKTLCMDRSVFLTIYELTREAKGEKAAVEMEQMAKMRALFDRMNPESARRVLRKWQRDPAFLAAVKQIDPEA